MLWVLGQCHTFQALLGKHFHPLASNLGPCFLTPNLRMTWSSLFFLRHHFNLFWGDRRMLLGTPSQSPLGVHKQTWEMTQSYLRWILNWRSTSWMLFRDRCKNLSAKKYQQVLAIITITDVTTNCKNDLPMLPEFQFSIHSITWALLTPQLFW
jgi:hypothetical protein